MHLRWRSGEAAAITLAGTASTGPASHRAFAFGFGRKLAAAVPPPGGAITSCGRRAAAVRAANLRWLAGYRHPRHARVAVMAALAEVFAERACCGPGGQVGDPLSVLPVLLAIVWRGRLADLGNRVLDSGSTVWATWGGRADDPASGAASGDTLRLGGETHGGRAGERQGAVGRRRWAVTEVATAGLFADRGLELVTAAPW